MRILFMAALGLTMGLNAFTQPGGNYSYGLLNLNTSARSGALGGSLISAHHPDISMVIENPAYLGSSLHNQLSLSYVNYFSDIQYGRVVYGRDLGRAGNLAAGIFYLNYGSFLEANEYGDITGEFQAAEYTFDLSWGYKIDSILSIGVNLRPVYSVFERYSSWGIASDAALLYTSPGKLTSAAVIIRNVGTQFSTYYSPDKEPLPFEVLAGFTQKIKHAPFRLNVTLRHLQKFDIDAILPGDETDPASGSKIYRNGFNELTSKALDHVVAGVEFAPGKALSLRFGYNFRNRSELKMETKSTASGLSFGLGLYLGKINIDYALASYHVSGMSHLLTVSADISSFN